MGALHLIGWGALFALVLPAGVLTPNLPWYAAMVLPVVFTAGMALFDSADGVLIGVFALAWLTGVRARPT